MTDDDQSLGDQNTLGGEKREQEVDARSLGDQSTHGDHSQMDSVGDSVGDSSSLGDQLTFAGEGTGGGYDHGQYIAFDKKKNTPLCNLFVNVLCNTGIQTDTLGSSTGKLTR